MRRAPARSARPDRLRPIGRTSAGRLLEARGDARPREMAASPSPGKQNSAYPPAASLCRRRPRRGVAAVFLFLRRAPETREQCFRNTKGTKNTKNSETGKGRTTGYF